MQIFCYDFASDGLNLLGICENATSILWTRKFFSGDEFAVRLPATPENIKLFSKLHVVELMLDNSNSDSYYCGIITDFDISKTVSGEELTVSGMSPDGFLERRILRYWDTGDTFMGIINKNAGDTALAARQFPCTSFMISVDFNGVYGEAMLNKKLSEYVKQAGQFLGVGLQSYIRHNFVDITTGKYRKPFIAIEARRGIDRSISQTVNKAVVFSDAYENATDFEYSYSDNGTVNAAIVYSEAQYNENSKVDVVAYEQWFDANTEGYERSEKIAKIKAVTAEESRGTSGTWTILDSTATASLAEEKANSLYADATEFFNCKLLLPKSYDDIVQLGDIVTAQNTRWGVTSDKRITEISHQITSGGTDALAYLGETYKNTFEILNNRQEG